MKCVAVWMCIRRWAAGRRRQTREFCTFTKDLWELADWLRACGVTHVALESTGVFWKPVWNLLEGQFEALLVDAQHNAKLRSSNSTCGHWTGHRERKHQARLWVSRMTR